MATNHSEDEEKPKVSIRRVGVDIVETVFYLHGVDRHDQTHWQAKLKRNHWLALCDRVAPGAEIGMEACAPAHYWGREPQKRG